MKIAKLRHPYKKLVYLGFFTTQLAALIYYLPYAIDAVSGDILVNRLQVNTGEFRYDPGRMDLIIAFVGAAWPISLTMFFYSILSKDKPLYTIMFLVCSLFGVIYGMAHVGRSGMIQWLMLFLLNYILFRAQFKEKVKSVFRIGYSFILPKLGTYVIAVSIILLFAKITVGRELTTTDYGFTPVEGFLFSAVEYLGESYGNFSQYYTNQWLDEQIYWGRFTSPLYYGILELAGVISDYSYESVLKEVFKFHLENGLHPGTFNTLLKELSIDYGFWGVFILCAIYCAGFGKLVFKKRSSWLLPRIFIYILLYSIPYYGVFFYSYGNSIANVTISYFVLAAIFSSRFAKGI
jgi:oligosaccharide repeat unit polymerase